MPTDLLLAPVSVAPPEEDENAPRPVGRGNG